ncbi:MAG: SH3 domain-containing protein [Helicobacter japonicus]|nr:SH3 domain-containing protein [Helicobacter japonicus]
MNLRAFLKVYSFPVLIVLIGLIIYGGMIILMDKEHLILSRSEHSYHSSESLGQTETFNEESKNSSMHTPQATLDSEDNLTFAPTSNEENLTNIAQADNDEAQTYNVLDSNTSKDSPSIISVEQLPENKVEKTQVDSTHYYVKHRANIRKLPSLESPVIASVSEKEVLELLEAQGEWSKIKTHQGINGYIASRLISKVEANLQDSQFLQAQNGESYIVLVDALNVRSAPDKYSNVVGRLNHNQYVSVLEIQGECAKIRLSHQEYGYVALQFIAKQ